MRISLSIVGVFLVLAGAAQDRAYVTELVKTLASPEFHGRGYYQSGHKIAADFVSAEMAAIGLSKFTVNYQQPFQLDVNTFSGAMSIVLDGVALVPGEDYIVHPACASVTGTFGIEWISRTDLNEANFRARLEQLKKVENKAFVLDLIGIAKDSSAMVEELSDFLSKMGPVIVLKENKLTWSVATSQLPGAVIEVLADNVKIRRESSLQIDIRAELLADYSTQNVVGFVPGRKHSNKYVVFSAHYDHLGRMGASTYFPGANDNASGTSMLLSLAKYFKSNPLKYTTVFLAFGAEEAGILGSRHFVENPLFPLKEIRFVLNMDIMGTGDEGITVVNGTVHKRQFKQLSKINTKQNYLEKVKARGKAMNSDHYWFTEVGVPAFFVYTMGGIKAYHDVYDRPETLPLTEYEDLFLLLTKFALKL